MSKQKQDTDQGSNLSQALWQSESSPLAKTPPSLSDDIIGLIVHGYNNYLSGLMGFAELAKLDSSEEEVKQKIDLALVSGTNAVDFGNQLLAAASRLQIKLGVIDIVPILQKIAADKNVRLNSIPSGLISSEAGWLETSLSELVAFCQSLKSDKQEPVIFNLSKENDRIILHIDADQLDQENSINLFVPFYTTRVMKLTTGVGLASVSGFFKQSKARFDWMSEGGFTIDFEAKDKNKKSK